VLLTTLTGKYLQNTHSLNLSHIASVLLVQVLHGVQCNLFYLNVSSNVQITKQAVSVSCSESLPLVTAITYIFVMVFGLGLS